MPGLFDDLLRQGLWPTTVVDPELVRAVAPGETEICLHSPPFRALAGDESQWLDQFRRAGDVDYAYVVITGDLALGSDPPIVWSTAIDRLRHR
jgi:hypothetical protein